jgi:hypothetical protein
MRALIVAALFGLVTCAIHPALGQTQSAPPMTKYHIVGGRTLACHDAHAVVALSPADARQRFGDVNYFRLLQQGNCFEVDNSWPLIVCFAGPIVSFMQQAQGNGTTACLFFMTAELADERGRPPAPGARN